MYDEAKDKYHKKTGYRSDESDSGEEEDMDTQEENCLQGDTEPTLSTPQCVDCGKFPCQCPEPDKED